LHKCNILAEVDNYLRPARLSNGCVPEIKLFTTHSQSATEEGLGENHLKARKGFFGRLGPCQPQPV